MRSRIMVSVLLAASWLAVPAADAAGAVKYPNCATMNKSFPHGVGLKKGLVNKGGKPVAYVVNKAVYLENKARDRDKGGIACEK